MSSFSWSVDPIACALGLFATWLAWKAYRASTRHLLSLCDVQSAYSKSVYEKKNGHFFSVTLLNAGLPITSPSVELEFRFFDEINFRTWAVEMQPRETHLQSEFSQGMRGKFELWIRDDGQERFDYTVSALSQIKNAKGHRATLVIKNAGYEVQRIPLYSRLDFVVAKWNSFAHRFNHRFSETKSGASGRIYWVQRPFTRLPVFAKPASASLEYFCSNLKPCGMVIVY